MAAPASAHSAESGVCSDYRSQEQARSVANMWYQKSLRKLALLAVACYTLFMLGCGLNGPNLAKNNSGSSSATSGSSGSGKAPGNGGSGGSNSGNNGSD